MWFVCDLKVADNHVSPSYHCSHCTVQYVFTKWLQRNKKQSSEKYNNSSPACDRLHKFNMIFHGKQISPQTASREILCALKSWVHDSSPWKRKEPLTVLLHFFLYRVAPPHAASEWRALSPRPFLFEPSPVTVMLFIWRSKEKDIQEIKTWIITPFIKVPSPSLYIFQHSPVCLSRSKWHAVAHLQHIKWVNAGRLVKVRH